MDVQPGVDVPLKFLPHSRRLVRKFASLDVRDQLALLPAVLSLLVIRGRLRLQPFRKVLQWADRPSSQDAEQDGIDVQTARRIRALERVGHSLFPRNPCLTEALAAHRILRRRGFESVLRIGVRTESGKFKDAHAWVEHRGEVMIGARGMPLEQVPLPPITSGRASDDKPPSVNVRDT